MKIVFIYIRQEPCCVNRENRFKFCLEKNKIGSGTRQLSRDLAFHGVPISNPRRIACEKCPHICVACFFGCDRGLEAWCSTKSAAIKDQRGAFVGGQQRGYQRETLRGDVERTRYMGDRKFRFSTIIDDKKVFFTFHRRFQLFSIYVFY